MTEKIKKLLKNRIFIFVLAALLFGTIGVSAATYFPSNDVTYDNTESGLESMNVQGAIDELYGKAQQCSSNSNDRVEDMGGTTTSGGDGLYKDVYEAGRYFFKGKNPNNYITFNEETAGWRIMSLESDGTIKIMKIASIGNRVWDDSSNDWRSSDLNTYLNETYYNSLNSTARGQVVLHNFNIGAYPFYNQNPNYGDSTDGINAENEQVWNGNVGLATVSEYLRSNSNTNYCRTITLNNINYNTCKNTNWMFNNSHWWTMSASTSRTNYVFYLNSNILYGYSSYTNDLVDSSYGVHPVVYLSSSVKLSGSGTQSDPYTIS